MLRKRLIGVVTVRGGWGVQSFGYNHWLPLGTPEVLVQNLDRWGVDEILLQCIDRSRARLGPDMGLLARIGRVGLATPLVYAGGIATVEHASAVVNAAADRIVVDSLLHDDLSTVKAISRHLGAQAVIAALPLAHSDQGLLWLDHRNASAQPLSGPVLEVIRDGVISETMVIDWQSEGHPRGFDLRLVDRFPVAEVPLIAFGGLRESAQHRQLLNSPRIAATAVGNFFAYREHAVQTLKIALAGLPVRRARYAGA